MDIIIIGILAIVGMGVLVGISTWISRRNNNEPDIIVPASGDCATCSGIDESCEQTCMMEAATKEVEYYDDEELDRFKGRASDDFSDDEAEAFAEVMQTMRPDEVKAWNRSLILRGINMPNQIKDDYIALAHD